MRHVLGIGLFLFFIVPGRAATVVVTVANYSFTPAMFTINPGDTVKWVWVNGHHNTTPVSRPVGAPTWYSDFNAVDSTYIYVADTSGLYQYTCTYHSGMDGSFFVTGCSFPPRPMISSSSGSAACAGDTVKLSIAAQAGIAYEWTRNMATIPMATGSAYDAIVSGQYRVVARDCGVDSVSDPFMVSIHTLPMPSFSYTHDGLLAYDFVNTSPMLAGHSFTWSFGDGSPTVSTTHAQHSYALPGSYTVTLRATNDTTGCSDSVMTNILASLQVNEVNRKKYILYPNPAAAYVQVHVAEEVSMELVNMHGRQVAVPVYTRAGVKELDVRNLPKGIYLLRIRLQDEVIIEKIMIH